MQSWQGVKTLTLRCEHKSAFHKIQMGQKIDGAGKVWITVHLQQHRNQRCKSMWFSFAIFFQQLNENITDWIVPVPHAWQFHPLKAIPLGVISCRPICRCILSRTRSHRECVANNFPILKYNHHLLNSKTNEFWIWWAHTDHSGIYRLQLTWEAAVFFVFFMHL